MLFRLSPAVLADGLEEHFAGLSFYPGKNRQVLEDVRFYSPSEKTEEKYIYVMEESLIRGNAQFPSEGAFILLGKLPEYSKPGSASVIVIPVQAESGRGRKSEEQIDSRRIFNLCLDIFGRHRDWSARHRRT